LQFTLIGKQGQCSRFENIYYENILTCIQSLQLVADDSNTSVHPNGYS